MEFCNAKGYDGSWGNAAAVKFGNNNDAEDCEHPKPGDCASSKRATKVGGKRVHFKQCLSVVHVFNVSHAELKGKRIAWRGVMENTQQNQIDFAQELAEAYYATPEGQAVLQANNGQTKATEEKSTISSEEEDSPGDDDTTPNRYNFPSPPIRADRPIAFAQASHPPSSCRWSDMMDEEIDFSTPIY